MHTDSVSAVADNQYYIKNHLGSTMFLTSGSGDEIIASFDYFPYGKKMELALTSEDAVTQTFTEKEQDRYDDDMDVGEDGEGWYYFGARYYDSDIGLWTSIDPEEEFWNSYRYTTNPINFFDTDGKSELGLMMKFYPKSSELINKSNKWLTSDKYAAYKDVAGATNTQVNEAFKPGNGPIVTASFSKDYSVGDCGGYKNGGIIISSSLLLAVENEIPGADDLLRITLEHEQAHYLDDINNFQKGGVEEGNVYETKVYGEVIYKPEKAMEFHEE